MKICFATSECVPFAKTGGLADVSGSLPESLIALGCEVKVFLPRYSVVDCERFELRLSEKLQDIPVSIGDRTILFSVWEGYLPGTEISVYLIECPEYFQRASLYTDDPDEAERFLLFQHAVVRCMQWMQWSPDVLHCNDWQTGLLPAFLKITYAWDGLFEKTKTVFTIHNIAYQGRFAPETISKAGIPASYYAAEGPFEFHGSFSFLKAGITYADVITTVSPTYAQEIQTWEYGSGMEGILVQRSRDVYGILNGIDTTTWSPVSDTYITTNYNEKTISLKNENKADLLDFANLPRDVDMPVIGIVSRFAEQKGFQLLLPVFEQLMNERVQFIILGSGDPMLESFFHTAMRAYPKQVFSYTGFSDELAHRITAGADMFLMPSRYEPCGMNQMYSLNYGNVPIVRQTGGLADTVVDYHEHATRGNGFSFREPSPKVLFDTVQRAKTMYAHRSTWQMIMKRGMRAEFSWKRSAKKYFELYEQTRRKPAP